MALAWRHDHNERPPNDYDDCPADANDIGRAPDLPPDMGQNSRDW
jgi:hypothetical protein